MSKKRGFVVPLTLKWRWPVISFDAINKSFLVLTAYHKELPEFRSILAEMLVGDTRTLLRYEFHGNHPVVGWHVHAVCGDITALKMGITTPIGQSTIPNAHNFRRRSDYTWGRDSMSDTLAQEIAADRFGLPFIKDLLDEPIGK